MYFAIALLYLHSTRVFVQFVMKLFLKKVTLFRFDITETESVWGKIKADA